MQLFSDLNTAMLREDVQAIISTHFRHLIDVSDWGNDPSRLLDIITLTHI